MGGRGIKREREGERVSERERERERNREREIYEREKCGLVAAVHALP